MMAVTLFSPRWLLRRVPPFRRSVKPQGRRGIRPPAVECLEDRALPSILAPVATFDPVLPASDSAGGVSQAFNSADGRFTVFTSTAPNLVDGQVHTAVVQNVFLHDRQSGAITLVSHTPGSSLAEADSNSENPRISSDGNYIVYDSTASNLVTGQTGARGVANVFLYNRTTDTTTLVSHRFGPGFGATSASGNSTTGFTTGFGFRLDAKRFLLFTSVAPDIVPGQQGPNHLNLFLYDAVNQTTTLVSHNATSTLTAADDDTTFADLTPDGGKVVFESFADDVVPEQNTNFRDNIFLYTTGGITRLVSGVFDGTEASTTDPAGQSFAPFISADGSVITYVSGATNLVANQAPTASGDTNNVFLYDTQQQTTTLVSHADGSPSLTANDNSGEAVLSSDGSTVAFISGATNLVPGQGNEAANVFVYKRSPTPTLTIASHVQGKPDAAGAVDSRNTETFADVSVSADGRLVSYKTTAQDLLVGMDNFGSENVFVYDTASRDNTLVSRVNGSSATGGDRDSLFSHLSADGSTVAFLSFATNLVPGRAIADGSQNLFLFDVASNAGPTLASSSAFQASATSAVYGTSGDGRFVVFTSNAPSLVPGQVDTNFDQDVFLLDRDTGAITLVSHVPGSPTTAGNAGSPRTQAGVRSGLGPVISADGNWVAFVSQATDLVADENAEGEGGLDQLYLFNRMTGEVRLISHQAARLTPTFVGSDVSDSPVITNDGAFVAYRSRAPDLVENENNGSFDTPNVFLYTTSTQSSRLVSGESGSATVGGDQASDHPTISDDLGGNCLVAYTSLATTLLTDQLPRSGENVYLFHSLTGMTDLVSHIASDQATTPGVNSMGPVLSHDGSTVAFVSFAANLVSGQQPGPPATTNVFLYDVGSHLISLASGAGGSPTVPAGGYSDSPALNTKGTRVAFRSDAPDLEGDQVSTLGSLSNVFLFDRQPQTPTVTLLSHAADSPTTPAAGDSSDPDIDGEGDLVVYLSTATNLVPGQQGGGVNNVFLYAVPLGANGLASGQGGSPVLAGSTPAYLALLSRDPVVTLNSLAGARGTSIAFLNKLTELSLSPNTVAGGSPPGSTVGTLSVTSVFAGQFLSPRYSLPPGEADNAAFAVGAPAGGQAALLMATTAAGGGYDVRVHINIGIGDESGVLHVSVGPPLPTTPQPPPAARPLTARLVTARVGKRKKTTRLMVDVFFADNGALKENFVSPFQKPKFQKIQVTVRGTTVVVTARKGKRTVTATFAG
jgi:hypothetical protein